MDFKQLEVFLCVAKHLSFSKAAEAMYISQPTASAYIGALEKYLGVQLLLRNTKEVSLTKAGMDFLIFAQQILSLREQARSNARGENRDAPGSIDILASTIPSQHLLPEITAAFRQQWPNVVFRIYQADSRQVEREMSGFRYDFGLMGVMPDSSRFVHYPIYDDELTLAIPKDETLSDHAIRQDFTDYILRSNFIMRESGSGTRTEVESLLKKIGADTQRLSIAAYFSDAHSILLAISRGMGVSLVSKIAAAMYVETGMIRTVDMGFPFFRRQIYLLHNKELHPSPLQQAFIDHARLFFSST